jgi:hypothetical protein
MLCQGVTNRKGLWREGSEFITLFRKLKKIREGEENA